MLRPSSQSGANGWLSQENASIMARIRKGKPLPHVLIPDTSVLWHEDKSFPVSPAVDKFLDDHEKLVELELVIPEVVRGELLFQQVTSATKLLDGINEKMTLMSGVTAHQHRHRVTEADIRDQVIAKVEKWVQGRKATVFPIPTATINWPELCHRAIWRLQPFSFDPKDSRSEKGFRDSLILETVAEYAKQETRQVNIAFVCRDALLRQSATERLKADPRFNCYESLGDFSSYIKLTRQRLTNEFINAIVQRAHEKFYKGGDDQSLWLKEKLASRIHNEHQGNLTLFGSFKNDVNAIPPLSWKPVGTPRFQGGSMSFQNISEQRTYHWVRTVTYLQGYRGEPSFPVNVINVGLPDVLQPTTAPAVQQAAEYVLAVNFNVSWKANVKDDARFHDVELEGITFVDKEFRPATAEERVMLGMDSATETIPARVKT